MFPDPADAAGTEEHGSGVRLIGEPAIGARAAIELRPAVPAALVAIQDQLLPAIDAGVLASDSSRRLANPLRTAPGRARDREAVADHVLDELERLLEHVAHEVRDRDAQAPRLGLDGVFERLGDAGVEHPVLGLVVAGRIGRPLGHRVIRLTTL